MDAHTLRVLEFGKILDMAASFAVTVPGKIAVQGIKPLKNIGEIRQRISLVSECRNLLSEGQHPGIEHFDDLSPLFSRIRPADSVLEPFDLRSLLPLFYSAFNLKILSESPSCPELRKIVSKLTTHPHMRKAIEKSIDTEGKIRDSASPELSRIRKSIKSCEEKIRRILDGILNQKEFAQYLQDFYLAERNSRWVIPVKTDFKGHIPGVVHDISNTGETVYVEPYSIQRPGNELESLRAEEKLEEYRIMQRLTALLRESLLEIAEDYRIVAGVDALLAAAGFSKQMSMSPPEINEYGFLKIRNGRHPLLWKTLRRENREGDLIPLDVDLRRENSCMVITGSNAGGKTVTLKTIGVLTIMALSGLHIPAASGTSVPFLAKTLADIGDEQSIEQHLSTFSAHITRIAEIIRHSGSDTLVIIDELGTGTDPEQGGALSCAILRKLNRRGALTLVSTHLGMLKAFAHSEPGMTNAAMEMKEVNVGGASTYRPTYRLVTGEPGTSHAFEIAESLGLQEDVIKEARGFMQGEGSRVESLITELKQKSAEYDSRIKEAKRLGQEAENLKAQLQNEISRVNTLEQKTMAKALRDAEDILRKTKREAKDILEALKKASVEEAKAAAKELEKKLEEVISVQKQYAPEKSVQQISKGQSVFVRAFKTHGIVRSVNEKAKKCKVLIDGREIEVPFTELSEAAADFTEAAAKPQKLKQSYSPAEEAGISGEINVIGQRVDPAISLIERYLNDASMAGLKQVKIIHGFGTGILSRAIRDYLKDHPLVESFRPGNEDEGGGAVTVVVL